MNAYRSRRWITITTVYWFLLLYIVAALIFSFVSLQAQNETITNLLLKELRTDDAAYREKSAAIHEAYRRKTAQYIGEGVTFLALILFGAFYIYRATRRQFRLSRQQQNFMMTVTHELKTPIAVARLNLETMLRRQLSEEQQKKMVQNTLKETERLNDLISNILLASQLDAKEYKLNKTNLDMSELTEQVMNDFAHRLPERKITAEIEEGINLFGEELLLQMMVSNLVENALKYSGKDKPVHVTLRNQNQQVLLKVIDEGDGIPEEERGKIFEKFYRIGNESTRTAKGTGLGLFLCKMIAKDHDATISITGNPGEGSTFTVVFRK